MIVYIAALAPLTWVAATDIRNRKISAAPLILLAALGGVRIALTGLTSITPSIIGLLCVGLPMLVLSCVIDHGNGIGGGDVKLCATLGFLLGAEYALFLIVAALLLFVAYAWISGRKDAPFAPFVLAGYTVMLALILLIIGGFNV
ncbi:MAG: prepilin peptidase [Oscillospiraceae bacterium]|nr:prepilin peptidase [Oscillospiraceae bacterium]